MDNRSYWKTILSVCLIVFAFIRLAYTCSDYNSPKQDINFNQNQLMNSNRDYYRNLQGAVSEIKSNQLLYLKYKQLDILTESDKKAYKVIKLKKDTLVSLDYSSKLKLSKEWYFQKNYDDSLKLAVKMPDDLTMFVHDFDSKNNPEDNFKSIKRGLNLDAFKVEIATDQSKLISYTITKGALKFNGYVFCMVQDNYVMFMEFESSTLSKPALQEKALRLIKEIIISGSDL